MYQMFTQSGSKRVILKSNTLVVLARDCLAVIAARKANQFPILRLPKSMQILIALWISLLFSLPQFSWFRSCVWPSVSLPLVFAKTLALVSCSFGFSLGSRFAFGFDFCSSIFRFGLQNSEGFSLSHCTSNRIRKFST